MNRLITFLSDFGHSSGYPAACKGVIKTICPETEVIDISHDIRPFDIRGGAFVLATILPYFPSGIHLGVVDPGVGSSRRIIIIQTGRGDILIGPDNGLLIPATRALGSISRVFWLQKPYSPPGKRVLPARPVSVTFQARDIMAPAAAYLAGGQALEELGEKIDPVTIAPSPWPEPAIEKKKIGAEVIDVDHFGAIHINITGSVLKKLGLNVGRTLTATIRGQPLKLPLLETFSQVKEGEPLFLVDSSNYLTIAANQKNIAAELGVAPGDMMEISW